MSDEHDEGVESYSVFEDGESDERNEGSIERNREIDAPGSLEREHDRGCPKCGHEGTTTDSIATTGTGFSKLFDVQNRRFTVVSCEDCGYAELYRGRSKNDVVDFFLG